MATGNSSQNVLHTDTKQLAATTMRSLDYEQGLIVAESAVPVESVEKESVQTEPVTSRKGRKGRFLLGGFVVDPAAFSQSNYRRRLLAIVFTIISIGLALGIGLGVGLTRQNATQSSAANQPSTTSPTSLPSVQLLADTSIAVCEDSSDRHVFFQATNGSIQHAVYSKNWVVEDLSLPSARPHSPLSALTAPDGTTYLFYVATDNSLTSTRYTAGSWQPFSIIPALQASNQTRQLIVNSVTSFQGDSSGFQLIMMTQFPNQRISTVHLSLGSTQSFLQRSLINRDLLPTSPYTFSVPCAAASNVSSAGTQYERFLSSGAIYPWVGLCCEQEGSPTDNLIGASFDGQIFNSSLFQAGADPTDVLASGDLEIAFIDGELSVLYISEQGLTSNGGAIPSHASSYPYTRMGTVMSGGLFYVYQQLDSGTIAEAVYDLGRRSWTSSNITTLVQPG